MGLVVGVVVLGLSVVGGDDGQPDSVRAVPLGPDAVLRALRGGESFGPPAPEAGGAEAGEAGVQRIHVSSGPDVPEHPEAVPAQGSIDVWVTFYTCPPYCGAMANGERVYDGAAACGYGFALGQRFSIENDPALRTYVCADRGLGAWNWVDVWFSDYADGRAWRDQLPTYVTVRLLP